MLCPDVRLTFGSVLKLSAQQVQLLLFSATFNDKVRNFALKIAPNSNKVFVPKESLSLDVIAQHNVRCPTREDKIKVRFCETAM